MNTLHRRLGADRPRVPPQSGFLGRIRTLLPLSLLLGPVAVAGAATNLVLSPPTNSTNLVFNAPIDLAGATLTVTVTTNTATMTGVLSNSTGTGDLAKNGAGTLVLAAANTYNGITMVSQGALRVGHSNALGTIGEGTTVQSGATVDLNSFNTGGEVITIRGTGVGNNGALVNRGSSTATGVRLVLGSDASVGGTRRMDTALGGTVIDAGTNTLTKVGSNDFIINSGTTTMGTLRVNSGAVTVVNSYTGLGDTNFGTLVASNASLEFWNSSSGVITNRENITLADGAKLGSTFTTNLSILSGNIILSGGTARVDVDSRGLGTLAISGEISGPGNLTKGDSGILELRGVNTYTGNTLVTGGTLRLISGAALRFVIGGNGTNNSLGGTGPVSLDGMFDFDLTDASTEVGHSWNILTGSLTNKTYGSNFLVRGFNGSAGKWTRTTNGVKYSFSQSDSTLSVLAALATTNYAAWVGHWQAVDPRFGSTADTDDPDGDEHSNEAEFAFGGNPTVGDKPMLSAKLEGDWAVFNYLARNSPPGGVSYLVQTTTNLTTGPWLTAGVTISNSLNQEDIPLFRDYRRKEFAVPATNSAFFRVRAVVTPDNAPPPPVEDTRWLPNFIASRIAAGDKEIIIPPGRYRVRPSSRQHLLLRGVKDTVIIADQVEMICTETTRAITLEDCENLTIRGLTIDYDPLPYTQGRITSISSNTGRLEVDILEGYEEPGTTTGTVEIFNPATNQLRGRLSYFDTLCQPNGPMRAVLTKSSPNATYATERVGDIALIKMTYAPGGSIPHAISATRSKGLVFDRVTLYGSNSFGILENGCDGSVYLNCRVARREPTDDFKWREHQRLRSLNADAFHSKNSRQGPVYDGCSAFFMGDDAIAINGDFHYISRVDGAVLRVLAKTTMTIQPGDAVQLFTSNGGRPDDFRALSVVADGLITQGERDALLLQPFNGDLATTAMGTAFLVTLDAAPNVAPGTLICNADAIGNGFTIRNCHVGHNRSRGILVKAGYGEITNNVIEGSIMTSILVSPEYWWLEAGFAENLLIADNLITSGSGMGIAVLAAGGNNAVAPSGAFRNITLSNNQILGGASPGLLLTSIRGLTEINNTVATDPTKGLYPWEIGSWGTGGVQPVMRLNIAP